MSKRNYSKELKMQVVERYLKEGVGYRKLAKEYQINKSNIQHWAKAYIKNGENGLFKGQKRYTGDLKLSVVKYMEGTGSSAGQTAVQFNVSEGSVRKWEKIYREKGIAALYENQTNRVNDMPKIDSEEPKAQRKKIKELMKELQELRMENDYLKKLNALVQKRERSKKKIK